MTRATILAVLERHESRCLDDEDDRAVVADALALALTMELQRPARSRMTERAEAREDR
jgi:hypothetical protein